MTETTTRPKTVAQEAAARADTQRRETYARATRTALAFAANGELPPGNRSIQSLVDAAGDVQALLKQLEKAKDELEGHIDRMAKTKKIVRGGAYELKLVDSTRTILSAGLVDAKLAELGEKLKMDETRVAIMQANVRTKSESVSHRYTRL